MDEARRIRCEKLRWRSRRALLELDILLRRFWEAGCWMDEGDEAALERLLAMEDHDLWDLLSGRSMMDDPQLKRMVERINGCDMEASTWLRNAPQH